MSIVKIRKQSVSAPFIVGLKSPPDYLSHITKANPEWGTVLRSVEHISATDACALWAGAVAVGNGCRISEVLRLRNGQVQPNGLAWVEGSKGSRGRLLYLGLCPEEAQQVANSPAKLPVFPVSYIQVWRACIKYGFASKIQGHKHLAVTHAGRYRLAQEIAKGSTEELAGEVLGHKSKNTIQYYVHPQGFKMLVSKKQAKDKLSEAYKILDLEIEKHLNKRIQNENANHV